MLRRDFRDSTSVRGRETMRRPLARQASRRAASKGRSIGEGAEDSRCCLAAVLGGVDIIDDPPEDAEAGGLGDGGGGGSGGRSGRAGSGGGGWGGVSRRGGGAGAGNREQGTGNGEGGIEGKAAKDWLRARRVWRPCSGARSEGWGGLGELLGSGVHFEAARARCLS